MGHGDGTIIASLHGWLAGWHSGPEFDMLEWRVLLGDLNHRMECNLLSDENVEKENESVKERKRKRTKNLSPLLKEADTTSIPISMGTISFNIN